MPDSANLPASENEQAPSPGGPAILAGFSARLEALTDRLQPAEDPDSAVLQLAGGTLAVPGFGAPDLMLGGASPAHDAVRGCLAMALWIDELMASGESATLGDLQEAARTYATLGEMCDALREVWGEYEEPASL